MSKIFNSWSHRNISLCGKVNLVNTLIASMFVYKMTVLPRISHWMINTINQMIEKFIWNNSRPKIPLSVLQSSKENGGLGLTNFGIKDDSLKISWIKMIFDDQYPADLAYHFINTEDREEVWGYNLHPNHSRIICTGAPCDFWRDVYTAWCKYHYTQELQQDHILWNNSLILIDKKPFCWAKCVKAGLQYVSQLITEHGYLPTEEICERYNMTTMEYNAVKCAIPKETKNLLHEEPRLSLLGSSLS